MTAAQFLRSLLLLPWSETRTAKGKPFFAMRHVENLEILVEGREAIIPLAEGKIDLANSQAQL